MTSADRPVLRSRAWRAATSVVAALVLVLSSVGVGTRTAALVLLVAVAGVSVAVLVRAALLTRRARRDHENALAAWAAERATQQERLRIARDLHDLASHGLGLISVRAAAARLVTGPEGAAERDAALRDVERVSREATTELRRMLSVLRTAEDPAPLSPALTLADLPRLLDDARAAGVSVGLDVGELGAVSPGAQLVLATVVREGLTNVARHAGPTSARVLLRRAAETVSVTIIDDGPAGPWVPHPGAGAGLIGLRERVGAFGGSLRAEPDGTGFRLSAWLLDRSGAPGAAATGDTPDVPGAFGAADRAVGR